MKTLIEVIKESLYEHHITPQETLVIGLSGGRDSVCLAFCLKELSKEMGFSLKAVHVNHQLRETALRDETFCRDFCSKNQIPLTVSSVNVKELAEREKLSLEDAARRLRYEVFAKEEAVTPGGILVTAHHAKDQAETLLLHLLRGSGMKGLGGMEPMGHVEGVPVLRPMLQASEEVINTCFKEHHLECVEDETNQDLSYTRNQIRHELLPSLAAYNPNIIETLVRTADILRQEDAFLNELAGKTMKVTENHELIISSVLEEEGLSLRILKRWLVEEGAEKDITKAHLEALLSLAKGESGRRISLPHGLTVIKSYDILAGIHEKTIDEDLGEDPELFREVLTYEEVKERFPKGIPSLPDEKFLDLDQVGDGAMWRHRLPGDYILLKAGRQKLKDLLINEKVPLEDRLLIPLLAEGHRILWALGLRIGEDVKVTESTQKVLHIKVRPSAALNFTKRGENNVDG